MKEEKKNQYWIVKETGCVRSLLRVLLIIESTKNNFMALSLFINIK